MMLNASTHFLHIVHVLVSDCGVPNMITSALLFDFAVWSEEL
jgi:hypothetical protein